ncbi:MAG: transposase [Planctomycetes bacterium]|nr:transposase [Planctomycetota bacterium]
MDLAQVFLVPANVVHRQYEALRAYFVEQLPGPEVARRFGYTVGSLHQLVHQFRQEPKRQFFIESPRPGAKADDAVRQRIIQLRKQNQSIYEISAALKNEGCPRTPVAVSLVLRQEGFVKLPRRRDDERPKGAKPTAAEPADARALNLEPRTVRTKFGGLFLFLPALAEMGFDSVIERCDFPGTARVPATHALRSLLALKLFGTQRHSHVMSAVLDEGLALFAGLNVIPKRSFLTEYSCRIAPRCYPKLMQHWFDAMSRLGLQHGSSFDLDFHTIPFHGEDALMEKHYVSKRSRRQKGILAFLAHDGDKRFFCYANSDLRKDQQNDEILRFVKFWKERTGRLPEELIFDSKLTTYRNLNWLNEQGIQFITLRRRSPNLVHDLLARPRSAWRQIELDGVSRQYKTPRILDEQVTLADYEGPIRQISIADLGHEDPTLLLTNQLSRSPAKLIERYAHRMLIENNIEDSVNFFHMDALSSAVALKVNCDVQLTLMASSLYRHLAQKIGNGYETVKSRHLFRDFIDAVATIEITSSAITVQFQKRAHNPLLLAAGFDKADIHIPWLGRRLCFQLG